MFETNRHFGRRETVEAGKFHDLALVAAQGRESILKDAPLRRVAVARGLLKQGKIFQGAQLRQAVAEPAASRAQIFECIVAREVEYPEVQLHRNAFLQPSQTVPGFDEGFGEYILSGGRILDDAQNDGVRGSTVAIVKGAHGLRVAGPNAGN